MTAARSAPGTVYDIVGIGFGPANLALAIATREANAAAGAERTLRALFCERKPRFEWHRDMLLDDSRMQVSFIKDLATLRNPRSEYTFLSYLRARGRLVDFVNHKTLYPSRAEFHDYLEWASDRFADDVRYGHEVVDVRPVSDGRERVTALEVVATAPAGAATDGKYVRWRTRNLVVGAGLEPVLPPGLAPADRLWHSAQTLSRVAEIPPQSAARFVVLGAGQSAAEVVEHLHSRFCHAQVYAVFSRYGYQPADDSSFVNRVFDPAGVDVFYAAPPDVKESIVERHANTNYSAVDQELIAELYRRVYDERVRGARRLHMLNLSRLVDVRVSGSAVELSVEQLSTGRAENLVADYLVCATGYRPVDPLRWLGGVADMCKRDDSGRLAVERDYRVMTADNLACGIYLQGATEHSHGLSSSLLSNVAVRAGEIVDSLAVRPPGTPPGAALGPAPGAALGPAPVGG